MIYSILISFLVQTPLYENGKVKIIVNVIERTVEIPMATADDCSRVMVAMKPIKGLLISCATYDDNLMGDGTIPLLNREAK